MVFQLAGSLVSPAVKGIYDALKTLFDRFAFQRAVVKSNLEYAIDVISEALIVSEYV
jgi:hypothetical protein